MHFQGREAALSKLLWFLSERGSTLKKMLPGGFSVDPLSEIDC